MSDIIPYEACKYAYRFVRKHIEIPGNPEQLP